MLQSMRAFLLLLLLVVGGLCLTLLVINRTYRASLGEIRWKGTKDEGGVAGDRTFGLWVDSADGDPGIDELVELMAAELPSVPFEFWQRNRAKGVKLQMGARCARHPSPFDLDIVYTYWQRQVSGNTTFLLFNAYFDNRKSVRGDRSDGSGGGDDGDSGDSGAGEIENRPTVRLLAMASQWGNFTEHFCQLWFDGESKPQVVPVKTFKLVWHSYWGVREEQYYPVMLTCDSVNGRTSVPQSVSLVDARCSNATNSLRVVYRPLEAPQEEPESFAICLKGLDFPEIDLSVRLIEWLELMRTLGASKVFGYNLGVHANVTRVLRHYEAEGFVEMHPLTLVGGSTDANALPHYTHKFIRMNINRKRYNEVVPYNDCLYRNMYRYRYLAVVDIDEVLMPLGQLSNWSQLLAKVEDRHKRNAKSVAKCPNGFVSFCLRQIRFPPQPGLIDYSNTTRDLAAHLFMLQHTRRIANHSAPLMSIKCLHRTDVVEILHNHSPISALPPFKNATCHLYEVSILDGQLQHYRSAKKVQWGELVVDKNISRFADQLVDRVGAVLRRLDFIRLN